MSHLDDTAQGPVKDRRSKTSSIEKVGNPSFVADQITACKVIIENHGGAPAILTEIASGKKEIDIAQEYGISVLMMNTYLSHHAGPSDIELARATGYQTRLETLEQFASSIPEEKKQFDARMEVIKYLAGKNTLKFQEKATDKPAGGITISFDWGAFQAAPLDPVPSPFTIDQETGSNDS